MSPDKCAVDPPGEKRAFLRASGVVSAITLLSRVLGLVRDMVLAACFGATRIADLFAIAFELPNLTRRVLGEGSLSAFIVPVFNTVDTDHGRERAWRFVNNALTVMAALALVITAAGIIGARPLFSVFGWGYAFVREDAEAIALGVKLTRIMFPFCVLLAVSSILMGVCHAMRRFAAPALGSVALNVCMIATGIVFWRAPETTIATWMAGAVLLGGVVRVVLMLPTLARAGYRYRPVFNPGSGPMRRLFLMMLPALYGLAVVQINITVSRAFATTLGAGFVPCLVNSNRLVQLPLAIIAASFATAILPQLATFWKEQRHDELRDLLRLAFRLLLIVFIPASVGLMVLGHPIIRILFERGQWDAQATLWTFQALLFYAPSLAMWGFLRVLTPVFYARHDVRTPVIAATIAMAVNIVLNIAVVALPVVRNSLGHAGLALANTIGVLANAGFLMWVLSREGMGMWDGKLTRTLLSTLAAAGLMAVVVGAAWYGIARTVTGGQMLLELPALVVCIALGGAVYFAVCYALRVPDLHAALGVITRKKHLQG